MNFYAGQLVNILPCYGKITTESLAKALDTGKVIFEYLTTDYVSRTKYAKVSECVIKDPDGEWYSLAAFLDALNLKLYSPLKLWDIDAKMIFLFFNDDECGDCSIARLRLSTDVNLNKMIDSGEVVFVCVYMEKYSDEWAQKARTDSDKWIIGANNEVADKYDLRIQPSVYILDANKVILDKNISADGIKQLLN